LDWGGKFANMSKSSSVDVEYVAFVADLPHWIESVRSGYRVTVTFHLFQEQNQQQVHLLAISEIDGQSPTASSTSLSDLNSFPQRFLESCKRSHEMRQLIAYLKASQKLQNKIIVFPLKHRYAAQKADQVVLKGGDAVLFQMLKTLDVHKWKDKVLLRRCR
jgi:hypothetical protein